MNKYLKLFMVLVLPGIMYCQRKLKWDEFSILVGSDFYTFVYKDVESINDLNQKYKSGYLFQANLRMHWKWKNYINFHSSVTQAGAKSISAGNLLEWNLNYFNLGASYGHKIIDRETRDNWSINMGPIVQIGYLTSGIQNVNSVSYDLKETDAFIDWVFSGGLYVAAQFKATYRLNLKINYQFDYSFTQIEGADAQFGQRTRNLGHLLGVGVGFNL